MRSKHDEVWRSPEEIVEIAFQRATVVMMNEAHSGWKRCVRTRKIGQRILPVAHQAGVRHLAMEALFPIFTEQCNNIRRIPEGDFGYLSQPEMRDFIQTALDLGWTLIPYEADNLKWLSTRHGIDLLNEGNPEERFSRYQQFQSEFTSLEYTNWREEQQALNLIVALQILPPANPLLVWCGNNHHSKTPTEGWTPMGYRFQQQSGINPFVIDQTQTVKFDDDELRSDLVKEFAEDLVKYNGTAGFLIEEAPSIFKQDTDVDAVLLSTQNELE